MGLLGCCDKKTVGDYKIINELLFNYIYHASYLNFN